MLRIFRHKSGLIGIVLLVFFGIIALIAPWPAQHTPNEVFPNALSLKPFTSSQFPLGTDDLGRDLLARLMMGARTSLLLGLLISFLSSSLGLLVGMVAGHFEGKIDAFLMRVTDLIMAFPGMLLAIIVVAVLGPGIMNCVWAITFVSIPPMVKLVRASVLSEKKKDYVMAAKASGQTSQRILFREILPNCLTPLIIQSGITFSAAILDIAALGFLGLGVKAPKAEWGTMLADARGHLDFSPHQVILPGLCLFAVVMAFNLLGDALRDTLDVKGRQR